MLQPQIIYKDENFLVLNKPAGWLTHALRSNVKCQISNVVSDWLLENFPEVETVGDKPEERPGIVHRLDKDTSGVLVVARKQKAFDYLKKLFQEHKVKKTYLALVYGEVNPPSPSDGGLRRAREGVINRPLGIISGSVKRTIHVGHARLVKEAVTKYKIKKVFEISPSTGSGPIKCSLLEVEPLTGRTHQIRVHLASIGHPVVGDKLYGPKAPTIKLDRQFLHADSIEFTKPDGGRLKISADLPEELRRVIRNYE